jgi:hypothetical protein
VRQLGFAGIALVWVFKTDVGGRQTVPPELLPAALLIVIGLTLDLLHYIAGSLVWGIYHRIKERAPTKETTEFLAPRQINWPALVLFWSKTAVMVTAYGFIVWFLYRRLV